MSEDVKLGFQLPDREMAELDAIAESEFRTRSWTAREALKIGLDYIRQRHGQDWWNEWENRSRSARAVAEPEPECGRLIPFRLKPTLG